jgi:CBS domain containing-hemolysin-like protein
VIGLSVTALFAMSLPVLALHLFAIALAKALRSYSPSVLEDRCAARGRPRRAHEIAHLDQRTDRGAEALAVLTGLLLAGLLGMGVGRPESGPRIAWVIGLALAIGLLGHVLAGSLGKVFAETILDATWPAAGVVRALAAPLTFGLRQVERLVEWSAGVSEAPQRPASVEVEIPLEEEAPEDREPELPEPVRALIQRVIELTRTDVSEIMTPRPMMVSLPATITAESAAATFHLSGLSRVPIFGDNHDDIIGILYAKDLFARMTEVKDLTRIDPPKLVRPVHFVPETKNAFDLLEELRTQRLQIAIVLDEYGGVAGLVTLEDLLEQLVGPISDEHDIPAMAEPIRELGESRYEVDATVPVEVLNERLGLHLHTNGDYVTVGGLAFHTLGRVPEKGETFRADGVTFQVVDVAEHRIRRLVLDLNGPEPAGMTD